ncbi:MAG: HAMP domain-containing histidine kinase [Desulfuromonas sp.]|nr:HAMP domain-containing histidine kinase [Desulfuromonas sp.]
MARKTDNPLLETGAGKTSGSRLQQRYKRLLEDIDFLFHEIRSPLTAVIGYSEFLQGQKLSVVEQHSFLDIISKEAHHIDHLLRDFSEIYHHENGSWLKESSFEPINIGDLLREAVNRFQNTSATHAIRIEAPPDLAPVRGNAEKLYLVLRNLLANAIKYSPNGGDICISAIECRQEVIIKIRDQGIGIPEECLPNIFKRGFRANLPEGKKPRGSGLGLTMVKYIVERHNGRIYVESAPGKGSIFIFSLPRI